MRPLPIMAFLEDIDSGSWQALMMLDCCALVLHRSKVKTDRK